MYTVFVTMITDFAGYTRAAGIYQYRFNTKANSKVHGSSLRLSILTNTYWGCLALTTRGGDSNIVSNGTDRQKGMFKSLHFRHFCYPVQLICLFTAVIHECISLRVMSREQHYL